MTSKSKFIGIAVNDCIILCFACKPELIKSDGLLINIFSLNDTYLK